MYPPKLCYLFLWSTVLNFKLCDYKTSEISNCDEFTILANPMKESIHYISTGTFATVVASTAIINKEAKLLGTEDQ